MHNKTDFYVNDITVDTARINGMPFEASMLMLSKFQVIYDIAVNNIWYVAISGMEGIMHNKDAMYIDLGIVVEGEVWGMGGEQPHELVLSLMSTQHTIDRKMAASELTLLKVSEQLTWSTCTADKCVCGVGGACMCACAKCSIP